MRKGLVCVALLLWASAITGWSQSARTGKTETIARWQFVGTRELAGIKGLPVLREVLALPATQELQKVALNHLAAQAAARFTKSADTNANAQLLSLLQPLLLDLLENESRFEFTTRGADSSSWVLAVKLPGGRVMEWDKNFASLAQSAQMRVTNAQKGWTAEQENYHLTFAPDKDWLLLAGGTGNPATKKPGLPKRNGKDLLNAEANLPAISKIWSAPWMEHGPKLTLAVTPRKDTLRSELLIDYPKPLGITPERWEIPTKLIQDPLIGFTAIQGIAGHLAKHPQFQKLGAQKTPNQIFLWAQDLMVFTMSAAADVGNPGTVISNITTAILPHTPIPAGARINVLTNRPAILWRGLPVVVPFIEAAEEGHSPFLLAGLFPVNPQNTKPAPQALFNQLKKGMVYYDWEITSERLKQWRPTWQLLQIIKRNTFTPTASDRWIEAIFGKLGNAVTVGTLENPRRLKLVRQSEIGFTALELVMLAHAIDPHDAQARKLPPPGAISTPRPRPPTR